MEKWHQKNVSLLFCLRFKTDDIFLSQLHGQLKSHRKSEANRHRRNRTHAHQHVHTHTHTHTHTLLSKKFFIPHFSGMWRNGMEIDASWTQMQKEIHQDWQLTLSTLIKWSRHSVISDTQKTAYSHISVDCTHHQHRQSSGEDVLLCENWH